MRPITPRQRALVVKNKHLAVPLLMKMTGLKKTAVYEIRKQGLPAGRPKKILMGRPRYWTAFRLGQLKKRVKRTRAKAPAFKTLTARCFATPSQTARQVRAGLKLIGKKWETATGGPLHTKGDLKRRRAWCKNFSQRSQRFWANTFFSDVVTFQLVRTRTHMENLFKPKGGWVSKGERVVKRSAKYNSGRQYKFAVGGNAAQIFVHQCDRWNSKEAERHFKQLRRAAGQRKKLVRLCTDNDRVYTSRHSAQVLRGLRVDHVRLPRRSPDLMPMDYGFFANVKRRVQEAAAKKRALSEQQFITLAKRTIRQSQKTLAGAIRRMPERTSRISVRGRCIF